MKKILTIKTIKFKQYFLKDILTHDSDFGNAALFMSIGIDFCAQNRLSTYTHILFILNKGLVKITENK